MEMFVPFTTFERSYHFQAIHGHIFKFWRVKSQSLGGERPCVKWKTPINTNEIPSELSHENVTSSHVKISLLLWLHMEIAPFDAFREVI